MTSPASEVSAELTAELVAELVAQQREIRFSSFGLVEARELGMLIIGMGLERALSITADVTFGDQQVFHVALPGTDAENDYWIARKVRSVRHFGDSSFLLGRRHAAADTDFNEETGLSFDEYVAHGGGFPIILTNGEHVGTVTVSGLAQELDHAIVVEALRAFLATH
jgi:uncharacterized protein (UPF0303 family)